MTYQAADKINTIVIIGMYLSPNKISKVMAIPDKRIKVAKNIGLSFISFRRFLRSIYLNQDFY